MGGGNGGRGGSEELMVDFLFCDSNYRHFPYGPLTTAAGGIHRV